VGEPEPLRRDLHRRARVDNRADLRATSKRILDYARWRLVIVNAAAACVDAMRAVPDAIQQRA
jgi:hypothetical protein